MPRRLPNRYFQRRIMITLRRTSDLWRCANSKSFFLSALDLTSAPKRLSRKNVAIVLFSFFLTETFTLLRLAFPKYEIRIAIAATLYLALIFGLNLRFRFAVITLIFVVKRMFL